MEILTRGVSVMTTTMVSIFSPTNSPAAFFSPKGE